MAQRGINKVILVGRIGMDPDVRYMPSGGAVCNLSLVTSETWRDKSTGEQKESSEGTAWSSSASWLRSPGSM